MTESQTQDKSDATVRRDVAWSEEPVGRFMKAVLYPRVAGRKTDEWDIRSTKRGGCLGGVEWYGPWRQYTFDPSPGTTFNTECLTAIAAFLKRKMDERG